MQPRNPPLWIRAGTVAHPYGYGSPPFVAGLLNRGAVGIVATVARTDRGLESERTCIEMSPERPTVEIVEANLDSASHQQAVVELVDAYAADPMGNGAPLSPDVRRELIPGLRRHPTTLIFLAWLDGRAVGIAVCFLGFSTFYARSLINIHDLAVLPDCRGRRIGPRLLEAVANKARQLGCCKLTLEVQENNHRARRVYEAAGFAQAHYHESAGGSLFYSKPLKLE